MMTGTVIVQPRGTAYPKSQDQIDQQARADEAALNAEGRQLRADLRQQSTNHKVFAGDDNGRVMVMRFVRRTVTIHVGQRVRFLNIGGGAPHTVTFGKEPPPPGLFGPSGDPKHFKGGNLNSGIIGPGGKFTVTFLKAGTFHYVCALHDFMGMKGKVVVKH
jgi:plastocyanin